MMIIDFILQSPTAPQVEGSMFSRCLHLLAEVSGAIPDTGTVSGEEGAITGYLFDEGPDLVRAVTGAMRQDPDLFSGYPDPAGLWRRQVRAIGWGTLHLVLSDLTQRTGVLCRLEQATVTREVLQVLRQARDAARARFAGPKDVLRLRALALGQAVLHGWQQRKLGKKAGKLQDSYKRR